MHRAARDVNHLAGKNIDPVEQLFRALPMNGLLQIAPRVTPGLSPSAICAPGLACATYQHSVFPQGCPARRGSSSGCTCTESFSWGNRNFSSNGKRLGSRAASPTSSLRIARSVRPATSPSAGHSPLCSHPRSTTPRQSSLANGDWDKSEKGPACPRAADRNPAPSTMDTVRIQIAPTKKAARGGTALAEPYKFACPSSGDDLESQRGEHVLQRREKFPHALQPAIQFLSTSHTKPECAPGAESFARHRRYMGLAQ